MGDGINSTIATSRQPRRHGHDKIRMRLSPRAPIRGWLTRHGWWQADVVTTAAYVLFYIRKAHAPRSPRVQPCNRLLFSRSSPLTSAPQDLLSSYLEDDWATAAKTAAAELAPDDATVPHDATVGDLTGGGFDSPDVGLGEIDEALDATRRQEDPGFEPFFEDSDATVAGETWGNDRRAGQDDADFMGLGSMI